MKALKVFGRIFEIIGIIACALALFYVLTFLIDSVASIANYDPSGDATDPTLGIALGGSIIFTVGLYYTAGCSGFCLIPLIFAIVHNIKAKRAGAKKMWLWLPILLVAMCPILEITIYIFLATFSA